MDFVWCGSIERELLAVGLHFKDLSPFFGTALHNGGQTTAESQQLLLRVAEKLSCMKRRSRFSSCACIAGGN